MALMRMKMLEKMLEKMLLVTMNILMSLTLKTKRRINDDRLSILIIEIVKDGLQ